jgi:uroporphyrinogen decarboxylase
MVESVRTYDYDYLKVNPRATYYAEAWGCTFTRPREALGQPEPVAFAVQDTAGLSSIRAVDEAGGPFAEQLEALRLIDKGLDGEVPLVQTVFSPLSVLGRLTPDRQSVRRWMGETPHAVKGALDAITETLAGYAHACLEAGADGIFFATTEWATYDALTDDLYSTFGRPYDLRVLGAVSGAPFNVLHVCRPNNMLAALLDYPAAAVNWAAHAPKNASLGEIQQKTGMAVMGGVDERHALLSGAPDNVRAQVREALQQTGGRGFLIAPGCSIAPNTPPENLRAAVAAARA